VLQRWHASCLPMFIFVDESFIFGET